MKNLMSLVAICKADLDSLGIKYGRVSNWTINTRAKCRLGQCRKIAGDLFDISISSMLLVDFTYKICNTEFNAIRVSGFSLIQMV